MTELKPCPFCGGEAEICEGGINGRMRVYGLIEHKDGCFFLADGLPTKNQHIMENDFATWNTRRERTCRNVHEDWEKTSFAGAQTAFCCSECGAHYVDCECYYAGLADAEEEMIRTNYCPNCGAKVVDE